MRSSTRFRRIPGRACLGGAAPAALAAVAFAANSIAAHRSDPLPAIQVVRDAAPVAVAGPMRFEAVARLVPGDGWELSLLDHGETTRVVGEQRIEGGAESARRAIPFELVHEPGRGLRVRLGDGDDEVSIDWTGGDPDRRLPDNLTALSLQTIAGGRGRISARDVVFSSPSLIAVDQLLDDSHGSAGGHEAQTLVSSQDLVRHAWRIRGMIEGVSEDDLAAASDGAEAPPIAVSLRGHSSPPRPGAGNGAAAGGMAKSSLRDLVGKGGGRGAGGGGGGGSGGDPFGADLGGQSGGGQPLGAPTNAGGPVPPSIVVSGNEEGLGQTVPAPSALFLALLAALLTRGRTSGRARPA